MLRWVMMPVRFAQTALCQELDRLGGLVAVDDRFLTWTGESALPPRLGVLLGPIAWARWRTKST